MPGRIKIYGRRPIALTAKTIRTMLDDADLYTLAEGLDLPGGEEAAVDAMFEHLRIDAALTVEWAPDMRPLQIEVYDGPGARQDCDEMLTEFLPSPADGDGDDDEGLVFVRAHLAATVAVCNIETHLDAASRLDGVLAEAIAYAVAEECDGIVEFYGSAWATPDDRATAIWERQPN